MTVIDELMVLFDDEQSRTLDDCTAALSDRTKQTLSSTLGRLTGKGWISTTRDRSRRTTTYQSTPEGQAVVTRTLDHLKIAADEDWDERWLFILFNIPEKSRKHRDVLRNRLTQTGFGRVQNSLWVTARDVRFELKDILDDPFVTDHVTILRPTLDREDAAVLAKNFEWEWAELNIEYRDFVERADHFLKLRAKDNLEARLLVYRYAKLLVQDPKFPSHLEPGDYQRHTAHDRYDKIRPFCYAA